MSITVSRGSIIEDSETGEVIELGFTPTGNIKLILPSNEMKVDIFEALFKEMKKLIDDL
jgi:hypothetical protein